MGFKFPGFGGKKGHTQAKDRAKDLEEKKKEDEKKAKEAAKKTEQKRKEDKELQQDLSQIYESIKDEFPYKLSGINENLKTGIDKLYSMINEKKSVPCAEAVKETGAPEDIVIEWARILEEHGLIRIHYPLFGKPAFRSLDFQPKHGPKKPKEEKKPEKKDEKAKPKRKGHKFTKKRLFIMAELVILGEILIYVFFVNRKLATNFLPNVISYISSITTYLRQNSIITLLAIAFICFTVMLVVGRKKMKAKKAAQALQPAPPKPEKPKPVKPEKGKD